MKHRFGVFREMEGTEYWGFWQNDVPHGEVWIQKPDGTGYGVEYEKGEVFKSYEFNQ
jgi:hypothetical protein